MGFVRSISENLSDAEDSAKNVAADIDDSIIQPVVNKVEAIVSDPKALAMVALSVMAPGAGLALGTALGVPASAAAIVGNTLINTAINGGDVQKALMTAAIPVVGSEIAGTAAKALTESGLDKALSESAGKVIAGTGIAAATGGDPVQALISGGLQQAMPMVTGQIEGFEDLSPRVQTAINRAIGTTLMGGDPSQSLINAAISAGRDAMQTEQVAEKKDADTAAMDALLAQDQSTWKPEDWAKLYSLGTAGAKPSDYAVQNLGGTDVFWNEYQTNLQDLLDQGGLTSQWTPNEEGYYTMTSDDGSTITVDSSGNIHSVTDETGAAYTPSGSGARVSLPTNKILDALQGQISSALAQNKSLGDQMAAQTKAQADAQAAANAQLAAQQAQAQQQQGMTNLLMLAGLSDAQNQQAAPVQVAPADVKSFEEQGYGGLFGGQLQFSDGGEVDDLLKLLKG